MAKKKAMVEIPKKELEQLYQMAEEGVKAIESTEDDRQLADIGEQYDLADPLPDSDNSRWELDASDIVNSVIRALRRETKMGDGSWKRPRGIKPIMNEEGVFDIASALSSYLSKDIALGNIKKEEAHMMTVPIVKSIIKMIKYKWRQYHLQKPYFDHIVAIIDTKVFFHFTRPVNEGERSYRKARMPMKEMYSHDEVHPSEIYGQAAQPGKYDTVVM